MWHVTLNTDRRLSLLFSSRTPKKNPVSLMPLMLIARFKFFFNSMQSLGYVKIRSGLFFLTVKYI